MSTASAKRDLTRFAHLPEAMITERRWVLWHFVQRPGDNKPTKVPYREDGETKASATDSSTWASYSEVLTAWANGKGEGIGFALGDGWCGFDLDHSLATGGKLTPWAAEIIEPFGNTYVERSPSGTGVKGIGYGRHRVIERTADGDVEKDAGTRKTRAVLKHDGARDGEAIEVYFGARYFTVTGDTYVDYPNRIGDIEAPLVALYTIINPPPLPRPKPTPSAASLSIGDHELIQKALGSTNGEKFRRLWNGDTSDHAGDDSSADLALCNYLAFWTGRDPVRMDSLFRQSGLMRPKWDEQRGTNTYGARTINKAIDGTTNTYDPNRPTQNIPRGSSWEHQEANRAASNGAAEKPSREEPSAESKPDNEPPPIKPGFASINELVRGHPHLRTPIIDGILRQGETLNIVSAAKAGKTWLMYYFAICLATGRAIFNVFPTTRSKVLYIDNELHKSTIAYRLPRVALAMGVSMDELEGWLYVESLRGKLQDIFAMDSYFRAVADQKFGAIILDALYRFMPKGFDENKNGDMAQVYNSIDRYAEGTGAAILCVHHASKGSQGNKAITDVGSGAGSQSRAVDGHLVLRAHEEDGASVLDAAVRSFKPIDPICLRWQFPLWLPATDLDPKKIKRESTRAPRAPKEPRPPKPEWTVDSFAALLTDEPQKKQLLIARTRKQSTAKIRIARIYRAIPINPDACLIIKWARQDSNL